MLRRRKANPQQARPEPIDPSTIPEAKPQSYEEAETAASAPVTDPEAPASPAPGQQVTPEPQAAEAAAAAAPAPPEAMSEAIAEPAAPAAETPEVPQEPDIPDVPPAPEVPEVPETPDVPETPQSPDVPVTPDVPEVPVPPDGPGAPQVPDIAAEDVPMASAESGLSGLDSGTTLPNVPDDPEASAPPAPHELPASIPPPLPDPGGRPADPIASLSKFSPPPPPAPFKPPVRTTLPSAAPLATKRKGHLIGGIDLGGTKIAAAVLGPNHEVVSYRRRPTPDSGGPADVVRAMATTIQEAAQDAGVEAHTLLGVGVGSPGAVDSATGAVSGAGNLPGWDGRFQLGMALREAIGTPVTVGNDVGVATDAEFQLGVGQQYNSLLGVFWGTGVGGGLILNGKPWHGRGKAGEIGHMVVKDGGAKCGCGNRGCMEAYAGRKSMEAKAVKEYNKGVQTDLFKLAEKHGKPHLTSAIWAKALEHEDELATKLLDRAVQALSAGIASAVNLLDPEAVVIGGGLGIRFGNTLVPKIIDGMQEHLFDSENPPPVKVAALGDEGGVIGASLLVAQPT